MEKIAYKYKDKTGPPIHKLEEHSYVYFYNEDGSIGRGWIEGVSSDGEIYSVKRYGNFTKIPEYSSAVVPREKISHWEKPYDSNVVQYATDELALSSFSFLDRVFLLQRIKEIARWAHVSGDDFLYVLTRSLSSLSLFKPLSPLTGNDSEWVDVSEHNRGPMWQNKRCSSVFKTTQDNSTAFDINGITWVDKTGPYYNSNCRVPVTFPYTPRTRYAIERK